MPVGFEHRADGVLPGVEQSGRNFAPRRVLAQCAARHLPPVRHIIGVRVEHHGCVLIQHLDADLEIRGGRRLEVDLHRHRLVIVEFGPGLSIGIQQSDRLMG